MGKIRDAGRTRAAIVAAALDEFAEKGFAGARMAAIGQRAGINKQLLYHYFGGKEDLFRAVVDRQVIRNAERQRAIPDAPGRFPEDYFGWLLDDAAWIRLLTWEAAGIGDSEAPAEAERRRSIAGFVAELRARQDAGIVAADTDPRYLLLAVYALGTYPLAFPQITRMTTGLPPSDPAFQQAWRTLLRGFGDLLLTPPGVSPTPSRPAAATVAQQSGAGNRRGPPLQSPALPGRRGDRDGPNGAVPPTSGQPKRMPS
jgi:AcrR family transcriptional regulator